MITARSIVKKYPGVVALDNVSFSFLPGEVVALSGANGAGKSTLARLIAGIERPDSGEISFSGTKSGVIRSMEDARNA